MRTFLCSAVVLALFTCALTADEAKKDKDTNKAGQNANDSGKNNKNKQKAKIVKVDAKNHTVTVRMKGKDGKEHDRKFKLTEEVRYVDSTGRVAAADIFEDGNEVLVVEEEGTLKELHKANKNDNNKGDNNKGDKSGEKKSDSGK